MKHFTPHDFDQMERLFRANLINSSTGYKPANLIATISEKGISNVAIFSSVVHLGANPAMVGFVQRPLTQHSHTYKNIKETGYYTINHIHQHFVEKAHYTSARFEAGVSEFDACKLSEQYLNGFKAPFVVESKIKMGVRFVEELHIKQNNTIFVIGTIEHLLVEDDVIATDGSLQLDKVADVAIAGLEHYNKVEPLRSFPYAKVNQIPAF
jgi:flavin reductase (DIM6/NTAB) family NADH-FMN oxidoreductase RutF